MTTPLADLDVQIERLLAFMNDVGRQVEACWVTLTSLPVDETSLLDWPAARAYYVIGRTPQVLDSQHYVNPYPRYAGAQRLVTSGRRYGIHVRVVAYHDDQVGRILLAGYAAADPTDLPPVFTRILTQNEEAHLCYAFANRRRVGVGAKHNNSQHFSPKFR
jgi:hypothetical protein